MIAKLVSSFALAIGLSSAALAQEETGADPTAQIIADAPDSDWRQIDAEDLVKISTNEGVAWVELADEFAPAHTARIRELARADWFDYKVWHRVISGFMAQGGGAIDNPAINAPTQPLNAEFIVRRNPFEIEVSELQERTINPRSNRSRQMAGFWNGFQVGTQRAAAAAVMGDGLVDSWLIHCKGAAAMARTSDPNSANAQFYIVTGDAEHLNTQYTVWGKVRAGQDAIDALKVGTLGEDRGFFPSIIEDVEIATDLEQAPQVWVMDTNSASFEAYLAALTTSNDGTLPDLCDIDVPVRIIETN